MSIDGARHHYEDTQPGDRSRSDGEPHHDDQFDALQDDSLPPLGGATVLLVEDDDLSRQAFELMFSHYGARVLSAESSAEALAHYDRTTPSILVSDIGLPDLDGCVLLRTIRARERSGSEPMPAIAISGSLGADAHRRAHAAGFDVFLAKPINISVLLHAMQNLLERRR